MKIVMISDLHITETFKADDYINLVNRMIKLITNHADLNEQIMLLTSGDIIEKGQPELFVHAKGFFDYLKKELLLHFKHVIFRFVPGNHDLCKASLNEFDKFIKQYTENESFKFNIKDTYTEQFCGMNFIYASSVMHKNYKYGKLNWDEIQNNLNNNLNNIIMAHHSLISENDNGIKETVVRQSSKFFEASFANKSMCYYLHGDTHKELLYPIGNLKIVIGVSKFFSDIPDKSGKFDKSYIPDISKQFLLIDIKDGEIKKVDKCFYEGDHDEYLLYPLFPLQKPILQNKKVKYEYPQNYIIRKVAPYDKANSERSDYFYSDKYHEDLFDVCSEKKKVVLLGEAGCGKSIVLQQIAAQIYESDEINYYPLLIKLNSYTNEKIEELISCEYPNIETEQLFIIFDGFDEIESKNIFDFTKRLNNFSTQYPETPILISARNNFYKFSDDNHENGTFQNFFEYGLCKISTEDKNQYITEQGIINHNKFWNQIAEKDLYSIVYNPFYFVEFVKIFKSQNNLPLKSELMDFIIKNRFQNDTNKYSTTINLTENKLKLMRNLEKLSITLQLMQKTYLTEDDYQELFPSIDERNLLNYSGIWFKQKDQWEFDHNNFREYLAAKFLSTQSIETIKSIITYSNDNDEIKESWINVLSFLVLIYKDSSLLDWLLETNPSMVVMFETSRIDPDIRKNIFNKIVCEHKEKNMWITRGINDPRKLSLFGQHIDSLNYLLNEIENPSHFRAQHNAIILLREFTELFGQETRIKDTLLKCCMGSNFRNNEKELAIIALAELKLNDEETTATLFQIFDNTQDNEILYGLYSYLLQSNLCNDYVDFFLDGILFEHENSNKDFSSSYLIYNGLLSIESYTAIKQCLKFFMQLQNSIHIYKIEDIFENICKKAENAYLNGHIDILNDMCNLLNSKFVKYHHAYENYIKLFFIGTKTEFLAFDILLNLKTEYEFLKQRYLQEIVGEKYGEILYDRYINNTLINNSIFISFVQNMNIELPEFIIYKKAILEKDNVTINKSQKIDYVKIRKNGEQKYFNSLFDKNKYLELLNELIEIFENPDILCEEVKEVYIKFDPSDYRQDLFYVVWDIDICKFEKYPAKKFLNKINWEVFSINAIYRFLTKKIDGIEINAYQKSFIYEYCKKTISETKLSDLITYKENGLYEYYYSGRHTLYFSSYFDFNYNKETFIDMLLWLPAFFHRSDEEKYIMSIPIYILNHLSTEEISKQIQLNIQNKNLCLNDDKINEYIRFCNENNLTYMVEIAKKICKNSENKDWDKRIAFEYLENIKGEQYIYDNLLPTSENILLEMISEKFAQNKNLVLEKCLIEYNQNSENQEVFLIYLIIMSSEYGINKYYDLTKEKNATIDGGEHRIDSLTEAIGLVKNIIFLPQMINLLHLRFSPKFKDSEYSGLYNALYKALGNMAIENYDIIYVELSEVQKVYPKNHEIQSFCNNLLSEIKHQYYKNKDIPWTIQGAKNFIK